MKQTITLRTEEHRQRAMLILESLPLDPLHEVRIVEYKKDRSSDQNSLLWKWYTVIGNELGNSKDDMHEHYKDKYLVSIFERDDPEYAALIQSIRNIWNQGMKSDAMSLRKKIVSLTSTTHANVKQMAEYLTNIEHDAASLAIRLPHPDEFNEAMGRRER